MLKVNNVTNKPAMSIPIKIKGRAVLKGILKINAQIEPVQAPVKGRGIATKITKASSFQFLNLLL